VSEDNLASAFDIFADSFAVSLRMAYAHPIMLRQRSGVPLDKQQPVEQPILGLAPQHRAENRCRRAVASEADERPPD